MFRSLKEKAQAALRAKSKRDSVQRSSTPESIIENIHGHTFFEPPPLHVEQPTAPAPPEPRQEQGQQQQQRQEQEHEHEETVTESQDTNMSLHALTETEAEAEVDTEPLSNQDPFAKKYVPFVESSILKSEMLSSSTSHYGRVNPSIMDGFGGDDESIWLVDDEEEPDEQTQASPVEKDPKATHESLISNDQTPDAFSSKTPPSGSPPATTNLGYGQISASILAGFDNEDQTEPSPTPPSSVPRRNPSSGSGSSDPYVALFEHRDYLMTMAYLRRLDQPSNSRDDLADDFSFGQRYQQATDTTDVAVTRQRVPADHLGGQRDCPICVETKGFEEFPRFSVTAACTHPPSTCLDCMAMSIRSDLGSKLWTEIRCPECRELLEYTDIEKYADKETFLRYETLALRAAMSEADNFIWCTSGCGSGQIHESGQEQPIVICLHCSHLSCFHHNVPWHKSLSCEEYDSLLADPENFKSRIELENEQLTQTQQAQLDADMAMARDMVAGEQADIQKRRAREQEERERATKAAALVRQIAARRRNEEHKSQQMVSKTTKPCPGCGWAIEKSAGCSHMTCIKCRYEFCWACHSLWARGHNNYCDGTGRR